MSVFRFSRSASLLLRLFGAFFAGVRISVALGREVVLLRAIRSGLHVAVNVGAVFFRVASDMLIRAAGAATRLAAVAFRAGTVVAAFGDRTAGGNKKC